MPLFNFIVTLSGVNATTDGLEDALYAAGCHDALICFYGTAVYLEFDRESTSLESAVLTAIRDIESAPSLNARVESIDSTLVGLSDIAGLTGLSRQAVALLKEGARGTGNFPGPVQRVKGNSPLWRWRTIVDWLVQEARISADSPLVEHAQVIDNLNLALQLRTSQESQVVLNYLHGFPPASRSAVSISAGKSL